MPRSKQLYLTDIVDAVAEITEYVANCSRDDFFANRMMRRAVLHLLTLIGEAATQLPADFRQAHPEIDWRSIIGFRHRAIHAYFSVKWDIVWETATKDAPVLAKQIAELLAGDATARDRDAAG